MTNNVLSSGANRRLVSQVKFDELDRNVGVAFLDFIDDRLNFALCAASEDDELGLASGEEDCGLATETTLAGTGDED